jgi:hypothetical protein
VQWSGKYINDEYQGTHEHKCIIQPISSNLSARGTINLANDPKYDDYHHTNESGTPRTTDGNRGA